MIQQKNVIMKKVLNLLSIILILCSGTSFSQNTGGVDISYVPSYPMSSIGLKKMTGMPDSTILMLSDVGLFKLNYDGSTNSTIASGSFNDFDTLSNGNIVLASNNGLYCYNDLGILQWQYVYNDVDSTIQVRKCKVDYNDRIVIAGEVNDFLTTSDFQYINRILPTGLLDLTFNEYEPLYVSVQNASLNVQSDNKIVFYDYLTSGITRLNEDGTLDGGFMNTGTFTAGYYHIHDIGFQSDGKLIVAGDSLNFTKIFRLNTDGTKDLTFNEDVISGFEIFSIYIEEDDKIIVGGEFNVPANNIVRLDSSGLYDSSFDVGIGPNDKVKDIIYTNVNDAFYIVGSFSSVDGNSLNKSAKLYGNNVLSANICYVTVDTATTKSMIVWLKESGLGIDYYVIHKEITGGVYDSIGVNYFSDTISYFIDTLSNPESYIHRYRISAVDSSGNISTLSSINGTINVLNLSTTGGSVALQWNEPEGVGTVTSYTIYEVLSGGGLDSIAGVPGTIYNYVVTSPTTPTTQYLVGIDGVDDCGVVFKSSFGTTILSNVVTEGGTASVGEEFEFTSNLYPNPATDILNVEHNSSGKLNYMIIDFSGRVIYEGETSEFKFQIPLENFSSGMYNLVLFTENSKITNKFIVQ